MATHVAFLRGMNLGNRRITNEDLCRHFESMGFEGVSAFLASGNVLFNAKQIVGLELRIANALQDALSYEVSTFLRSAEQIKAIAESPIFAEEATETVGKLQIGLIAEEPSSESVSAIEALASSKDRLRVDGRELHWLPSEGVSKTELNMKHIDALLGPITVRTKRTFQRLAIKLEP